MSADLRPRWSLEVDFAAQLIVSVDDLEFAGFDGRGDNAGSGHQFLTLQFGVFLDTLFDRVGVTGVAFCLGDSRRDVSQEMVQVVAVVSAAKSGRDRTAALMTQNDDKRNFQVRHGVLYAGDAGGIGDVSGYADDEQFPDSRVEYELRSHAAVRAAQDDGPRFLLGQPFVSFGLVSSFAGARVFAISLVSIFESLNRVFRIFGRCFHDKSLQFESV